MLFLGSMCVYPIIAQESANFKLKEHVFNEGGNPNGGIIISSANFRVTIDSIGDSIYGRKLYSSSFHMDGGFLAGYPPPEEVHGLLFQKDHITLKWNPERSVGTYDLYRDLLSHLSGGGFGTCKEYGIMNETTTDNETPSTGQGYFYLVTAENRLEEEGTKGYRSNGTERANPSPCP